MRSLTAWRVTSARMIRHAGGDMREFEFVRHLAGRLTPAREDTRLAIGDDAAIIAPGGQRLAITTDTLIAGRHFPDDTVAFDIGYKALAANCSDLAAMAAAPAWATVALTSPSIEPAWVDEFLDGARAATKGAEVDLVGGDTTRGALSVTVTAVGTLGAEAPTYRSAARAGDLIAVTGTLGDAGAGLAYLQDRGQASSADADYLVRRLHRPEWRDSAALAGLAHAAIDVSDGLLADLGHVLEASGCGARLDIDALPVSPALRRVMGADTNSLRQTQLISGDDYELCLTLSPESLDEVRSRLDCVLTPVGEILAEPELRLVDASGAAVDPAAFGAGGWDHFGCGEESVHLNRTTST